jgi:DNA repair protein RecO (recombination protein O)
MLCETQGVVLKQVKTMNGVRMLKIFTKEQGKISAGTSISEKGKNKSALAIRPFTLGSYQINRRRDMYYIQSADTIKNFYKLGENVDKYMYGSYSLELTDKVFEENQPSPHFFELLVNYLQLLEGRSKGFDTLLLAFQIQILNIIGQAPHMDSCVICGSKEALSFFSIPEGGLVCSDCQNNPCRDFNVSLIYPIEEGIINVLKYFLTTPIINLEKMMLDQKMSRELRERIKTFIVYHLDLTEFKSERILIEP